MCDKFIYLLGSVFLLLLGFIFTLLGFLLMFYNLIYIIDWEVFVINTSAVSLTFIFDWMSFIFSGGVLFISSMVVFYSYNYMISDVNKVRFIVLLYLFIVSMILMVMSPNLISILIGWDGLGLVSYCLVIYFQSYKSYSAGMLTILTNRIGDVFILLSIAVVLNYGSWCFFYYLYYDYVMDYFIVMIILSGFTKSAQIPFSSWLPAAMAAPTPVSSLVHSSTLVTAGVYLLIRFNSVIYFYNNWFFLFISTMTMFMAGLIANFEFDLKKVIALSTLSQLGLMMSILFVGFYNLAFFHMLMHAFFSALLFLCAGLMIHCMNESQDIRHMGFISHHLPFTSCLFCISNMSLCGFPFLSGFYSKDLIVETVSFTFSNLFIYILFYVSVGLTLSYSIRLIYFVVVYNSSIFCVQSYYEDYFLVYPMVFLCLLSLFGGSLFNWLIFDIVNVLFLDMFSKLSTLIFMLLGFILGHFIFKFNISLFLYFNTNMWFLYNLSTFCLCKYMFLMTEISYSVMDSGWGEFFVSKSYSYISYLGYLFEFFNNFTLKVYLFLFIFFIFLFFV